MNIQDEPAFAHVACCTMLCLLYGRHARHVFRFHRHRLDSMH